MFYNSQRSFSQVGFRNCSLASPLAAAVKNWVQPVSFRYINSENPGELVLKMSLSLKKKTNSVYAILQNKKKRAPKKQNLIKYS